MPDRLTSLSHGAGCACKMPLEQLTQLLGDQLPAADERLLVGPDLGDDAAVWDDGDGGAIVATTDFFTPVVDDPRDWGRIAAANAASDVYAMGGRPLFALNVVGWPKERALDGLRATLAGAAEVAAGGGWLVAGGHTIDAAEPFFGQAVVGRADPQRLLVNRAARPGDALVLTKPIGTGIVMTAAKRAPREAVVAGGWLHDPYRVAVASMTRLNDVAAVAALDHGAVAATDVTGFGLLGHLHRMASASKVAATVEAAAVPLLPDVEALLAQGFVPGGTKANLQYLAPYVDDGAAPSTTTVLADAQTSGGLLVALAPDAADALVDKLAASGHTAARIGMVHEGEPGRITVG